MKSLIVLMSVFASMLAFSGVNRKNGNFYKSFRDLIIPGGGHDLEIVRTYNSKSTYLGFFGFGQGSDFETHLKQNPDGSINIFENGSGAVTRFLPKTKLGKKEAAAAANKIIEAMEKKGLKLSAQTKENYLNEFSQNEEKRRRYAKIYDVQTNIANGTTLYSNDRGLQELHVTKDGFLRKLSDGRKEYYNKKGLLREIKEKDGYTLTLAYDGATGRLKSIKDNQAKQLFFNWYQNGRVKEIKTSTNQMASYVYKDDNLVHSIDIAGNVHEYDYDRNHNLTAIYYMDKKFPKDRKKASKMAITYEPKTQFVSSITNKRGIKVEYNYGSDPKNPDLHYWTVVKKKNYRGKPIENRYEWEVRVRPDGSQYTYRTVNTLNGITTETVYNECCSLPVKIKRGKHETLFSYNERGLLTKKTSTKGEYVELEYHDTLNKVSKVKRKGEEIEYSYNAQTGDLLRAKDSKGRGILLKYEKGEIVALTERVPGRKKDRLLTFSYDPSGRPEYIEVKGVGKIQVRYTVTGQVKDIRPLDNIKDPKKSAEMVSRVAESFRSLFEMVEPAGVGLNL